ncbi:fucose-specific lectin [Wilcoxina mikolae CBS 423.85]|nr:fucose-specific lectin [Wilcoxina mikolae CBS 423.85]
MGTLTSPHSTTAVSQGPGLIDLFVISGENLYWKSYSNMRWTPNWFQLGGNCPGKPAVVSWGTDRLDLFIRKNDGKLGHKSWDGKSWHPSELDFNYLDGLYDANPVAVSRGPGSIDLFIVAKDGELHHKRMENGRWLRAKGFDPLGGNFDQSFTPTVTVCGDRLDIMILGDEAATGREHYHKWWNGRWGPSLRGYDSMGEWGASTRISAVASQNIPRPTS